MFLTLDLVQFLMKQWLVDIFSVAVGIAKLYKKQANFMRISDQGDVNFICVI